MMKEVNAEFLQSNVSYRNCPQPDKPEIAFIGRSNVGKSSLINMLVNNRKLAKTSSTPGKTQLINHFVVDNQWYLVDLPGYGFAKLSKDKRTKMDTMIKEYLLHRKNLLCVMVLVDIRIDPQNIDKEFINWLGIKEIPFVIVFTKADKQSASQNNKKIAAFRKDLLKVWEFLPELFVTSSKTKVGKSELLEYIQQLVEENPIKP